MTQAFNISAIQNLVSRLIGWLCLTVAIVLVFAQSSALAHSHEHPDEAPEHGVCEYCILAVSDDIDLSFSIDQSGDPDKGLTRWIRRNDLRLTELELVSSVVYRRQNITSWRHLSKQQDAPRAPPPYH